MIDTVLFDLDGTLLPMDVEEFVKRYFGYLKIFLDRKGYDSDLFMKGFISATKKMYENDGLLTNETIFWKEFTSVTSFTQEAMNDVFLEFYENEFQKVGEDGKRNENMREVVCVLKEKGYRLLLTTNPLFPKVAVIERLRWAGIDPGVFEYITTYENSTACKPSKAYYEEVLKKCSLDAKQCIMVGNDPLEDGAVTQLAIPLYLVEDDMIKRENTPFQSTWNGSAKAFLELVKSFETLH